MPARVQQHVAQRPMHLARRLEQVQMVAIREDLPSSSRDAIHRARDPRSIERTIDTVRSDGRPARRRNVT
jgi:hypothetical protein